MSKGARKTGRIRHRQFRGSTPMRSSHRRPIKTTILIVGEGRETEPNYFDGLKRENDVAARFAVTIKKGHGFSPQRVVDDTINHKNRAESRGEDFDEVWCVLDVEGSKKRKSLEKAITIAQRNGIRTCLSNPSFEVWLLSHFEGKGKPYNDCDAVIV